jgi:hypothetical protein
METLLTTIQRLVMESKVRVSVHGFEQLAEDDISFATLLDSLATVTIVEEYQDYHKGPCILVLHELSDGLRVHALWGVAKAAPDMATLITAYRPDPAKWSSNFTKRLPK